MIKDFLFTSDFREGFTVEVAGILFELFVDSTIISMIIGVYNKIKYRNAENIARSYLKRIINRNVIILYDLFDIDKTKTDYESLIVKDSWILSNILVLEKYFESKHDFFEQIAKLEKAKLLEIKSSLHSLLNDIDKLLGIISFSPGYQMYLFKYRSFLESFVEILHQINIDKSGHPFISIFIKPNIYIDFMKETIRDLSRRNETYYRINTLLSNVYNYWWVVFIYPLIPLLAAGFWIFDSTKKVHKALFKVKAEKQVAESEMAGAE